MTERQKVIIEMFHSTHSLLQTCREDLSIMIEQHGRHALLADRIVESARRLGMAIEALPHIVRLLEAIDSPALTDEQYERAYEPQGEPIPDAPDAVAQEDGSVALFEGAEREPGDAPDEPSKPPAYRTGAEKRAAQAAEADAQTEEERHGDFPE